MPDGFSNLVVNQKTFFMGPLGFNELLIIGFIFIALVPTIFFLITQQATLNNIQVQNRAMSPGEVWLQLIPLFGLVWQFIVVSRIADSISRELASENSFSFEQSQGNYSSSGNEKPTYNIGIAYCVLLCCSVIPYLGVLAAPAGLICWIIYWVRLSKYKNKLQMKRNDVVTSASV